MRLVEIHQFGKVYDITCFDGNGRAHIYKDYASSDVADMMLDMFDDSVYTECSVDLIEAVRALIVARKQYRSIPQAHWVNLELALQNLDASETSQESAGVRRS